MGTKKITKAPCRHCHLETKHILLAIRQTSDEEEIEGYGPISWKDTYEMLECCGCETVVLCHTHNFSEDPDLQVRYYPPPVSRAMPSWRHKTPHKVNSLMDEVYKSLDADGRRLALMGARALVDITILDKVGDAGTFQQKLQLMVEKGFLSRESSEFLSAALDAGNAAAHRGYYPTSEQLDHVMDIVENLLQAVYVLKDAAAELRKTTPQRIRKKKTS